MDTSARRLRILVVEDEELNRRLLRATIERRAEPPLRTAELLEANTLGAARVILAAGGVDLVILDVRLPDGSGLDLARTIAGGRGPRPRIIILSASVRESDRDLAADAGADVFLGKPYRPLDLLATIDRLLFDGAA